MQFNCPRCGAINKSPTNFCSNCGIQILQTPKKPKFFDGLTKQNLLIIGLTVVFCLGLGLLAMIGNALNGKQAKPSDNLYKPPATQGMLGTEAGTKVDAHPTEPPPTPKPTFAELKSKSQPLLSLSTESEYTIEDLKPFDEVMNSLREIPKDAKEYKEAQVLLKKLIDKSALLSAEILVLGEKPKSSGWDGRVQPVVSYLRKTLNDYDSSEFVEWSPVAKVHIGKEPYWGVRLKLRAKNAFGGYILRDTYYFIRNNEVVMSKGLGAD
jgi:hypothetical protein